MLILFFQGGYPLREGIGGAGFKTSPSRKQNLESPSFCLATPGGQMRRIKPFPAQQSTTLTGMLTGLCLSEDPELIVCRKFPSRGFLRHFGIHDGMKITTGGRRLVERGNRVSLPEIELWHN